ncbi:hypothetical protein [Clostridium sp.]|uniref:hypothetical protein n=1 Tax=Clostridium sp. TaxID=1506 RepID=UPI003F3EF833
MKCERCGERGLLKSDLIGDLGCVSCYGNDFENLEKCDCCGKDLKGKTQYIGGTLKYDMVCFECFRECKSKECE